MSWRVTKLEANEVEHSDEQFVAESVVATQMDFEGENMTGTAFPKPDR